jgi:hypothetical protein
MSPEDPSSGSTNETDNRRRGGRVVTQFESLFSAGRSEGSGTLADISYSGALIEGTSATPEIGKPLRIYVFVEPVSPFELVGTVIRHTDNGFAIEYPIPSEGIQRFVDDAAAIVNARTES